MIIGEKVKVVECKPDHEATVGTCKFEVEAKDQTNVVTISLNKREDGQFGLVGVDAKRKDSDESGSVSMKSLDVAKKYALRMFNMKKG